MRGCLTGRLQPACGNVEAVMGHQFDEQCGGVPQVVAVDLLPGAGPGERHAACRRRAAGAVDDGGWGLGPPVEHRVRQLLGDGEQRVTTDGQRPVEPSGVDAVVEPEDVEVGLMGQVQRRRWTLELDEEQGCGAGADPAGREPLAGGGDGFVGRVADPKAARGWVEPVARGGEGVPAPQVVGVGVETPPGPAGRGGPQAGRPGVGDVQDWSPASRASATAASTSPSASRSATLAPSAAGWAAVAMASTSIGSVATSRKCFQDLGEPRIGVATAGVELPARVERLSAEAADAEQRAAMTAPVDSLAVGDRGHQLHDLGGRQAPRPHLSCPFLLPALIELPCEPTGSRRGNVEGVGDLGGREILEGVQERWVLLGPCPKPVQ